MIPRKVWLSFPLSISLLIVHCLPTRAPAEGCSGNEVCGTVADCPALCATVSRLECAAAWQIDESDGACLELCESSTPGLCPLYAAAQTSCEALDRATECGK